LFYGLARPSGWFFGCQSSIVQVLLEQGSSGSSNAATLSPSVFTQITYKTEEIIASDKLSVGFVGINCTSAVLMVEQPIANQAADFSP
jgi:hypothetical protein